MKRILIFIGIAALMLTSCKSKSIAVIGGADDPTAIYVADADKNKTAVRMICVDGDYYYDTGVSDNTPRCGTLDGDLEKKSDIFSVPKGDGSANFEGNPNHFGYQSNTSITKTVFVDGKCVVFRKVEDYGEYLDRYKYCYTVNGRHPNAAVDSEYLVMTNEEEITFDMITKYFFSSQLSDHMLDAHIVSIGVSDEWGIKMTCKNVTPEGMTVVFEQLGGSAQGDLDTGDWYKLEKFADGRWTEVEPVIPMDKVGWNDVAYMLPKNEISEFKIDWKWLYGELLPGTYRISKKVTDFKETGNFEEKVYNTQCVIE